MKLGFYANALLLAPGGFDAALSVGPWLVGQEARQCAEVATKLTDELDKMGYRMDTKFFRENVEDIRRGTFRNWADSGPAYSVIREAAARQLMDIPPEIFAKAAQAVMFANDMSFDLTPRAHQRAKKLLEPKEPWNFLTRKFNRDYGRWAERLLVAGKTEEAKQALREHGFDRIREGRKMLGFLEGTIRRRHLDFGAFQFHLAINDFKAAAEAFGRAGSELNRVKALNLIETARREVQALANQPSEGPPLRVTFREIIGDLARDVDRETDADIIHYARFAAMGSREGMEIFLRQAAIILEEKEEDILNALADPTEPLSKRIADQASAIMGIDPNWDEDFGSEPLGAVLRGGRIFGKLQAAMGEDNVILDNLVRAAQRYYSESQAA